MNQFMNRLNIELMNFRTSREASDVYNEFIVVRISFWVSKKECICWKKSVFSKNPDRSGKR